MRERSSTQLLRCCLSFLGNSDRLTKVEANETPNINVLALGLAELCKDILDGLCRVLDERLLDKTNVPIELLDTIGDDLLSDLRLLSFSRSLLGENLALLC